MEAEKLYHHLVGKLELTPEQKKRLWEELRIWFDQDPEEKQPAETHASIQHLIHRMG